MINPAKLLGLLPGLLRTVGQVTGLPLLSQAADAIGGAPPLSPEQQAAMQSALQAHEEKLRELGIEQSKVDTDALKALLAESIAMIQSSDRFVSRARPSQLYAFVAVNLVIVPALIFGWHPDQVQMEAIGFVEVALGGNAAWYQKLRTEDKKAAA